MTHRPTVTDLDRLAEFAPSVRALARAIVDDGHIAEDVVQDALLVALQGGVDAARERRGWFAGVVRNLARRHVRGDVARRRREQVVARPEALPATSETVARTEVHRRVVAAVLGLPEPYRETLLMRYFDELPPREIAVRLGVPGGTVRSRVTRGVELLRQRFDHEESGDRRAWASAFVPLLAADASVAMGGSGADGALVGDGAARSPAGRSGAGRIGATTARTGAAGGWGALLMAVSSQKIAAGAIVAFLLALLAGAAFLVSDTPESVPSIHLIGRGDGPTVREHVTSTGDPSSAAAIAGAETADEVDPRTELEIFGLVLRPDRTPAGGAHVRCIDDTGTVTETRADVAGRFELRPREPGGLRGQFTVQAWDDAGNAATERMPLMSASVTAFAPTLLLRPAYGVVVRVLDDEAQPVRGVRVVCREYDNLLMGVGETDAVGIVRFDHLPDCDVVVRAYKEGAGRAMAMDVVAGRPVAAIELRLTKRDVRVRVVDFDGAPVSGIRFFAQQFWSGKRGTYGNFDPAVLATPTDADGRTTVRDVAEEDGFGLRVLAPRAVAPHFGRVGAFTGGGASVESGMTEVEVVLPNARRLRWPIVAGTDPPADGARLRLTRKRGAPFMPAHLSATAWVEEGQVVADVDYFPLDNFGVKAIGPEGQWCVLDANAAGQPVAFVSPQPVMSHPVILHVVDSAGRPVAGLRTKAWGVEFSQSIETDDQGSVLLEHVPDGGFDLRIGGSLFNRDMHGPDPISGLVRIAPGTAEVTLKLPEVVELVLHLQIDGKPGIPPTLTEIGTAGARAFGAVEDPATGVVRVRVRGEMNNAVLVVARAYGFQEARATARRSASGAMEPVTLNLRTGAVFRGRVIADPARMTALELQVFEAGTKKWKRLDTSRYVRAVRLMGLRARGDGSVEVRGLLAGRYRLLATEASIASEPVDIAPGIISPVCVLQVTETVTVTGHIEFPDGVPMDGEFALFVEANGTRRGAKPGRPGNGIVLTPDGHFSVTIPDGQATTLRVLHPTYPTDSEYGSATVSGTESGVVLRLARGGVTTLRIPGDAQVDALPATLPVVFFATEELGEPVDMKLATRNGHELRIGGHPIGTFTLWVDLRSRYAPVVLRDVELPDGGGGVIDLDLTEGASVAVRITDDDVRAQSVREGALLRATWASPGGFKHSRTSRVSDDAPLVVTGLLPGTYEIQLRVMGAASKTAKQTVTIESPDQRLELDLDPR